MLYNLLKQASRRDSATGVTFLDPSPFFKVRSFLVFEMFFSWGGIFNNENNCISFDPMVFQGVNAGSSYNS